MTPIQNPLIPMDGLFFSQGQGSKASSRNAVKSDFDLLLATFDLNNSKSKDKNNVSGSAMDILGVTDYSAFSENGFSEIAGGSQAGGMIDMYNMLMAQMIQPAGTVNKFAYSPEFASTFGLKGPLIDYINMITQQLNLTKEQNQAFQDIAVNNKDATQSEEWVQKIAKELREASIG